MNTNTIEPPPSVPYEPPTTPPAVPKSGTAKTRWVSVACALVAASGFIFAALRYARPEPKPVAANPDVHVEGTTIAIAEGAPHWKLLKMTTVSASEPEWSDPVPATVKVDEALAARVSAPLAGRITRVFVELGEHVKAGQPLFSVASPSLAELTQAASTAKVDLDTARASNDRVTALVEAGAIPAKDAVASAAELKRAELGNKIALSKLAALRVVSRSDNEFVVKSPREGSVVAKNVLPGQEVGEGDSANLMMVADLSKVWVVAELFESNATGIRKNTGAQVELVANPDVQREGTVDMVSSVVDPDHHTIPVRVVLDNTDGALKPNTSARMRFLAAPVQGAVDVPATAIVTDGSTQAVYVKDPSGGFSRRSVSIGPVRNGRTSVLRGLKPGETIVESGAVLLDNQVALAQ